jgi:hypothetical protein
MAPTGPLDPQLWSDHGRWQVVRDETCLYLPRIGTDSKALYFDGRLSRVGYWLCRVWCLSHGYGSLR